MEKHITRIPATAFDRCVTPAMAHGALGNAGARMERFTHSGIFQPIHDWIAHDLRNNLVHPYAVYVDPVRNEIVVIQDQA